MKTTLRLLNLLYTKNLKCEVKNIVKMIKIFYIMLQKKPSEEKKSA